MEKKIAELKQLIKEREHGFADIKDKYETELADLKYQLRELEKQNKKYFIGTITSEYDYDGTYDMILEIFGKVPESDVECYCDEYVAVSEEDFEEYKKLKRLNQAKLLVADVEDLSDKVDEAYKAQFEKVKAMCPLHFDTYY